MDNYLLMGHILHCKLIPQEQVHPELWIGANRKWRTVPHDRVYRVKHNKVSLSFSSSLFSSATNRSTATPVQPRTEEQRKRVERKLLKKQSARQAKIRVAGINYDIGAAGYVSMLVMTPLVQQTHFIS
jgi:nucleolar protein 15